MRNTFDTAESQGGVPLALEIQLDEFEGVQLIRVSGDLDYGECQQFRLAIDSVLSASAAPVALDLSAAQYVDSSGLGLCRSLRKELEKQGRSLIVISNETVDDIMQLTRLDAEFRLVEHEEQALSELLKEME